MLGPGLLTARDDSEGGPRGQLEVQPALAAARRGGQQEGQAGLLHKLVGQVLLDLVLEGLVEEVVLGHMTVQLSQLLLAFPCQVVVDFLQDFLDGV